MVLCTTATIRLVLLTTDRNIKCINLICMNVVNVFAKIKRKLYFQNIVATKSSTVGFFTKVLTSSEIRMKPLRAFV